MKTRLKQFLPSPSHIRDYVTDATCVICENIKLNYGASTTVFEFTDLYNKLLIGFDDIESIYTGRVLSTDCYDKSILIFDPEVHGWDGMHRQETTERSDIFEVRNLHPSAKLIIAFQYSFDDAEDFEGDGNSDTPEDCFDWVVLYTELDGELTMQFEWECA